MPKIKCPCVNCPDKGCGPKHSTCELYLNYSAEIKRVGKKANDEREIRSALSSFTVRRCNTPSSNGISSKLFGGDGGGNKKA